MTPRTTEEFNEHEYVSLRFDEIEKFLEERDLRYKEKWEYLDKALAIQAVEYERRLVALNHEAEQLKSMQATYMPRETYERDVTELRKELRTLNAFKDNLTGRITVTTVGVSIVVSVILLVINHLLTGMR